MQRDSMLHRASFNQPSEMIVSRVLLLFLIVFSSSHVDCSIASADKDFWGNLTRNYNPKHRPVYNRSEVTIVTLLAGLNTIFSLDEKEEVFSCSLWIYMGWKDRLLTWNSSTGSPGLIQVPITDVWTPHILLQNSVKDDRLLKDPRDQLTVGSSGSVAYVYYGQLSTRCKVDISKFPFDRQVCHIRLSPLPVEMSGEAIVIGKTLVNLDIFEESGEFFLLNATLSTTKYEVLSFRSKLAVITLTLLRRRAFYVLNNILPVVFLSVLNTFVFLLPEESGEKMTMCISTLLSYVVFLTLVSSYLPENSNVLCYFSVYLVTLVLISALTCIVTLFLLSLNSHMQTDGDVPVWLRMCFLRSSEVEDIKHDVSEKRKTCRLITRRCNLVAYVTFVVLTFATNVFYFISISE